MRRDVCLSLLLSFAVTIALVPTAFAQQVTRIEHITFETNVVPDRPSKPILLRALLYIPTNVELPISAVVITPSSGGVREDIEIHYASNLARSGIAALVIDSFGSRGVAHTVHDQRLVDDWQMVNDAIAGLRQLIADRRFKRDRVGILGVSKGGIVAMNTALTSVLKWAGASDIRFAAHVAIVPHCGLVPRARGTTGSPLLFLLAELDDQCPPACAMLTTCGMAEIPRSKSTSTTVLIMPGKSLEKDPFSIKAPRTSPGVEQSSMRMEAVPLPMARELEQTSGTHGPRQTVSPLGRGAVVGPSLRRDVQRMISLLSCASMTSDARETAISPIGLLQLRKAASGIVS